ncbi:hypothetical protein CSE899_04842 [Cronobacter sakazakii E899]|nr:hypothetical protein CSE899_04842 [Cronobacter sakazakii E899]
MTVKGITFAQVKARAFENAAVQAAYEQQIREEELSALLIAMRTQAGLTKNDVAEKWVFHCRRSASLKIMRMGQASTRFGIMLRLVALR